MSKGILFVISAPSGTGKTTLLGRVMPELEQLTFSVSHTTRKPRPGEVNGRDYHFVEKEVFKRMIEENRFIEWARVHENFYGTSIDAVAGQLNSGGDVILDIDVQGAAIVRKNTQFNDVHIFVSPPELGILEKRLLKRDTDSEETIRIRLDNARMEMQAAADYDYIVVNDVLDDAADTLRAIMLAERSKNRRMNDGSPIRLPE